MNTQLTFSFCYILTLSTLATLLTGCHQQPISKVALSEELAIDSYRPLSINWPNNISNKSLITETVLSQLRLTEHRNIEVSTLSLATNSYIVEVFNKAMLDDSIEQIFYRIKLVKQNDFWIIDHASQAFKCRRGSTTKLTANLCP
mgnify:CR=1 FL=1